MPLSLPAAPAELPSSDYTAPVHLAGLDPQIAGRLPAASLERLAKVRAASSVLSDSQAAAFAAGQAALRDLKDAEATLSRYKAQTNNERLPFDQNLLDHYAREIEAARARANNSATVTTAATARSAGTRAALAEAIAFVSSGRRLRQVKPPVVPADSSLAAVINGQREVLDTLAAAKEEATNAWPDLEDALVQAHSKIAALAADGKPRVSVGPRGVDVLLPEMSHLLLAQTQYGQSPVAAPDVASLAVRYLQGAVTSEVEELIRQRYAGNPTQMILGAAERAERLADIEKRRLAAERLEIEVILGAWSQGDFTFGLRADTSPQAVLSVE